MEKTDTVAGVVVVVAELLPSLNGVFLGGIGSKPNRVNLPILTLINWSEKIAEFLTAVVTSSSIPDQHHLRSCNLGLQRWEKLNCGGDVSARIRT